MVEGMLNFSEVFGLNAFLPTFSIEFGIYISESFVKLKKQ